MNPILHQYPGHRIRVLVTWGRERYLSATVVGKKHFAPLKPEYRSFNEHTSYGVTGSQRNHYTMAPSPADDTTLAFLWIRRIVFSDTWLHNDVITKRPEKRNGWRNPSRETRLSCRSVDSLAGMVARGMKCSLRRKCDTPVCRQKWLNERRTCLWIHRHNAGSMMVQLCQVLKRWIIFI